MKLHFEYTSSLEDYIALADITAATSFKIAYRVYLSQIAIWPILLILASYVAYISPQPFLIAIFIGALCGNIYDITQYKKRFWKAVYKSIKVPKGTITLDISDEGFRETCEAIVSFAPWSCVTRYDVQSERILIELSGRLWAIIPEKTLAPNSDSLDQLANALRDKITEQGAAANP
jgi:hypothetical protein